MHTRLKNIEPVVGKFLMDKISLEQIQKYIDEGLGDGGDPKFALKLIQAFIAPQRLTAEAMG